MIKILTTIVSLLGYVTKLGPMIYGWFEELRRKRDAKRDAEAIKQAKKAETKEDRAKSAKNLFDRTNS